MCEILLKHQKMSNMYCSCSSCKAIKLHSHKHKKNIFPILKPDKLSRCSKCDPCKKSLPWLVFKYCTIFFVLHLSSNKNLKFQVWCTMGTWIMNLNNNNVTKEVSKRTWELCVVRKNGYYVRQVGTDII